MSPLENCFFKEMAHITDLPNDVFSKIIILVAKSPEGARDVARSLPTCKRFLEASNNVVVQRAVCFENVKILGRVHLFQRKNGLLNNCAKACNPLAEHLLSQVILVTCTRLVIISMSKDRLNYFRHYIPKYESRSGKACKDGIAASFIAHFTPVPKNAEESDSTLNPRPLFFHWEFAKSFISNCTRGDIEDMAIHLHNYVELFTGLRINSHDVSACLHLVSMMFTVGTTRERNILVQYDNNRIYKFLKLGFVPPPNTKVIHWTQAGALFEKIRVKTLDVFDVIVPKLR